ncbi:glycoside hydrolase family 3 C-terminal domain-containing protein [Nocardioides conyzicola]
MTSDIGPHAYYNAPIPRLGIPAMKMADATAGIGPRGWTVPGTGDRATAMPAGLALAASFDPELAKRYASVVTDEARRTGHNILLGPNADIIRQPWWGRESETMSEDPLLTSAITTPYVREVQSQNVIADMKHYIAYNQETNRANGQNTIVSERAIHETYLPPYEAAIRDARLGSVMCSFNKIGGTYACENDHALGDWLRDELNFDGFVISDFGAVHSTVPSVLAGTDVEAGTQAFYGPRLVQAVANGELSEADLDASVLRILRTMFRIGLFDTNYTVSPLPVRAHGAVARQVEERAITLLKNGSGANAALPLRANDLDSIAVIGGDANIAMAQSGAPYVKPTYSVSPLDGIRNLAEQRGISVDYAPGTDPVNGASMLGGFQAVPSAVLRPQEGNEAGLTAYFWKTTDRAPAPDVVRVERQVNYDVALLSASDGLRSSQVLPPPAANGQTAGAAVYRGTITPPTSGEYRFSLSGWGTARLEIGGKELIDMSGENGYRTLESQSIDLQAGRPYDIRVDYVADHPLAAIDQGALKLGWETPSGTVSPDIAAAAKMAHNSDAAIVVVTNYESEQRDRDDLVLPNNQNQLISEVLAANPNTIVVLQTGGPVEMPWLPDAPAVVQTYFGGQEVGSALANVLFGRVAPQGRLPLTYPASEDDVPVPSPLDGIADPDVSYDDGVFVGYRSYATTGTKPLFAFGHGLTYTRFRYGGLRLNSDNKARIRVSFTVRNVGSRAGVEVPQVYLGSLPTSVPTPARSLAGWARVQLRPGQTRRVTVTIDRRQLSYWSEEDEGWVTPAGSVRVFVGSSVADTALRGTARVN